MNQLPLILFIAAVLNFASSFPQYDTVIYAAQDASQDGTQDATQDDDDSNDYNYETDDSNERSARDVEQQNSSPPDEGTSTTRPHYPLSDVIHGFEDSIVHSAIALSSAFKTDPNENTGIQTTQKSRKRSTEDIITPKENVTSKHVTAGPNQEEHIAIDHVAVFKPTAFPLFSLLPNVHPKPESTQSIQTSTEASTTQGSTQSSTSTTESVKSETTSSTESATSNPIKKIKEDEDKIKDKVAEIEADPVILSARV